MEGGGKLEIKQYIEQSTAKKGYFFPYGFHMTPFTTLLFPETAPLPAQCQPLHLFFATLFHLGLDEQKEADSQRLQRKTWLKTLYPAPLGDDRQRFLYLLNNIRNRKDDYSAQLSQLTLASFSAEPQFAESRTEIIQTMLETRKKKEKDNTSEEEIWQARLVLAIAEIVRQQRRDITQAMQELALEENQLISSLQGEFEDFEDKEISLTEQTDYEPASSFNNATTANIFKAWLTLVSRGKTLLPRPKTTIWTATQREIADILIENHHKREGRPPLTGIILHLPKHLENTENEQHSIAAFKKEAEPLQAEIGKLLTEDPAGPGQTERTDLTVPWKQMVNRFFPEKTYGKATLTFYHCNRCFNSYFPEVPSFSTTSEAKIFALFK